MDVKLNILKTTVNIGLKKPVKLLQITDSHIALDDDGKQHIRAFEYFEGKYDGRSAAYFHAALKYASDNGLFIINTGDTIDFFSKGNFDFLDKYLNGTDYIYAAGNHDFCHCVGLAKEDRKYKRNNIKIIAPHIKTNLCFDSVIIGEVNIVTIDDSYYLLTHGQIDMLKAEVAKGYPILLCMHIPIFTPDLADFVMLKQPCSYVIGATNDYLNRYPSDRRDQQKPDESTVEAIKYIKSESMIKAVFSGHIHNNFETKLNSDLMQYCTHGTYDGFVREITVI